MTNPRTGNLILIEELGGFRHILDGRAVHAGDVLEFFDDNRLNWTLARLEVILGKLGRQAVLCTADDLTIAVDDNTRLRWPTQQSI